MGCFIYDHQDQVRITYAEILKAKSESYGLFLSEPNDIVFDSGLVNFLNHWSIYIFYSTKNYPWISNAIWPTEDSFEQWSDNMVEPLCD